MMVVNVNRRRGIEIATLQSLLANSSAIMKTEEYRKHRIGAEVIRYGELSHIECRKLYGADIWQKVVNDNKALVDYILPTGYGYWPVWKRFGFLVRLTKKVVNGHWLPAAETPHTRMFVQELFNVNVQHFMDVRQEHVDSAYEQLWGTHRLYR